MTVAQLGRELCRFEVVVVVLQLLYVDVGLYPAALVEEVGAAAFAVAVALTVPMFCFGR